jgi:hypothetical protein
MENQDVEEGQTERRRRSERRQTRVLAYVEGALNPRRRAGRRAEDRIYPVIDWHSPRVLALVLGILGLSFLDGAMTLVLMSHGATEANPVMALLLPHNPGWFAAVKLSLTAAGVVVLVVCSRMRLFRSISGEILIVGVLLAYIALIAYELKLLSLIDLTA